MNHHTLRPVPALVLCALLWSTGGFLIKLVDWNPLAIAGVRSLIGAVTICAVLRRFPSFCVRQKSGTVDREATFNLWAGAVCYALTLLLFVAATKMTTAANAVLLQYTNPVWVILFGPVLLNEKNRKSDYLAVAGVMAGMLLFFSGGLSGGSFSGNILAVLSGITDGFMSIFMRRQKNGHPEDSFTLSHFITLAVSLPFWFVSPHLSAQSVLCLFLLGIFQIGIPSILYAMGISRVRALSAGLISMLEPLMNPVWVLLAVHEVPSGTTIAGGMIILGSIVLRAAVQGKSVE